MGKGERGGFGGRREKGLIVILGEEEGATTKKFRKKRVFD